MIIILVYVVQHGDTKICVFTFNNRSGSKSSYQMNCSSNTKEKKDRTNAYSIYFFIRLNHALRNKKNTYKYQPPYFLR